jgi:hypothetical protein
MNCGIDLHVVFLEMVKFGNFLGARLVIKPRIPESKYGDDNAVLDPFHMARILLGFFLVLEKTEMMYTKTRNHCGVIRRNRLDNNFFQYPISFPSPYLPSQTLPSHNYLLSEAPVDRR